MLHDELKEIAKKVRRLELVEPVLTELYNSASCFLQALKGKADEFIPEDVWEDNLKLALKRARRVLSGIQAKRG